MTKNKKNIGMIALFVVLALLIVFGVLYFAGVFDKKPVEVEPVEVVEKEPEAIGNITGIDHGEIEFDEESGEATNLEELEEKNPPKAEEKEFTEAPVEETPNPDDGATTQEPPKTEPPKTEPPKEETPPASGGSTGGSSSGGSSGGTATVNGRSVRAFNSVSDLNGLTPQKPFETVSVNGVPYKWTGSMWADASQNYADTPNDYTEIGGLSGIKVGQ